MKVFCRNILFVSILTSSLIAEEVDTLEAMLSNGSVSGQIRLGYYNISAAELTRKDTSATAVGGQLKFETASLHGLSFGSAVYASHVVSFLSGKESSGEFYTDLTSSEKHYIEIAEAYVNYTNSGFNFRGGRQLIDTPLADSDDVAMTPHTFEAYLASYKTQDLDLTFLGGKLLHWHGVGDSYNNVINNRWSETGSNGTWLAAALFNNDMLEVSAWYYGIRKSTNAIYTDAVYKIDLGSGAGLTLSAQYLRESELNSANGAPSGVDGSIVGIMAEASHSDLVISVAYNSVSVANGKEIFEGFGGGSSYTNMDTMGAGALHDGSHKDGSSFMSSASYDLDNFNFLVAYGDFKADAGSAVKAHVSEIDLALSYASTDDKVDFTLFYIIGNDKESNTKTAFDDDHIQATLNYNF